MFANLDREKFVELLNKLGAEDNQEVLTAARDLHAQVTVAGVAWNDLLVPEPGEEPEPEADADDSDDSEPAAMPSTVEELFSDVDESPLNDAQKKEAETLIDQIAGLNVSADTKEELDDYREDLKEGEMVVMDLNYLRALHKRLS